MKSKRIGFGQIPQVRFNRSKFDLSHGVKTSANVGQLFPIKFFEVLPGDTFKADLNCVARVASQFLKPVMDNLFLDINFFFVPYRLVYDKTEKVFGNPNPSAYIDNNLESFPTNVDNFVVAPGSVGDYLGLPYGSYGPGTLNLMPFRAFALIYDQWFRNQSIIDEMFVQKGEGHFSEVGDSIDETSYTLTPWRPNNYCNALPYAGKKKDYFTSCLPRPQKGSAVDIFPNTQLQVNYDLTADYPFKLQNASGSNTRSVDASLAAGSAGFTLDIDTAYVGDSLIPATPASVDAFLNVNDLRLAFQTQKMLERDALYGSRYPEYLLGHFGVSSPDSRLQFTEFLGGGRVPISITQTVQQSASTSESALGNVGAYSLSNGKAYFNKGFVEHGYVFAVGCVRQLHTYQQGVPRAFMRYDRNDLYDPLFASLGEQPVYKSQLYYDENEMRDNLKEEIFGYNEAWADYRYSPSMITGQMRSTNPFKLDIWHFADKYNTKPYLNEQFVTEKPTFVDRTLAVPSSSYNSEDETTSLLNNFIFDFWFNIEAIRVMPAYSVPGLIDHH